MSRVIGVDHGGRRVGLAVGDEETGMAFPRSTVPAGGAVEEIVRLAAEEGAGRVVVGLPRNMDGTEGSQAAAARAFGQELMAMGLDVSFSDERLTTWEAEERSRAADRSHRANAIDSAAAALILEQYFADQRRHPEES
ncbi:MAG TPA: Holliday junction resolvase RuvX [Candidatus Limnocylindria bacterium]|nr:Holliday junction resolvase RuvX [Candidatus Limnocylindria bacterium]